MVSTVPTCDHLYPADITAPLLLYFYFSALDCNKSFKNPALILLSAFTGYWVFLDVLLPYRIKQGFSTKKICKRVIVIFLLTDSNNSVYQVLIPLQQNTEEEEKEEEILSKSLLLNLSVSGAVLKGTSLVVLDKDHIAVLGSLPEPGKKPKGNLKNHFKIL